MRWKKTRKWLLIIAIVYIAGGIAFYFLQDYIFFRPVTLKRQQAYTFPGNWKEADIAFNQDDTLNLVHFFATDPVKRGVVLYFHGNKKNISRYAEFAPFFTRHGYDVIMIDYPGFGKSKGPFTEDILYEWSLEVYKFTLSQYPADSIIIYGKSMGTGLAAQLASIRPCRRLILETPYYDFPSVIQHFLPIYPVRMLMHYEFPTHNYLPWVKAPVTIFHGTNDGVITYRNAQKLRPLLKATDEFITVKGGKHNGLYKFPLVQQKLDSLLKL